MMKIIIDHDLPPFFSILPYLFPSSFLVFVEQSVWAFCDLTILEDAGCLPNTIVCRKNYSAAPPDN